jgi:cobalt-zinc-cadmium efflux system outer membrane protein
MKQKKYFKLLVLGVAVLSATGLKTSAEEPQRAATKSGEAAKAVTLDALVAESLEKNPELNFYKAEIAAAKGERRTSGTIPNPELNAEIGRKRVSGSGLSSEGTAWSISVLQPFEYPGRIALRKAIANRQIELAEIGYGQFRAALAARVRTLGYGLLVAQEKSDAAQKVANRGQELVEVLVQRDPAGVTPLLETRIIEASVIVAKKRATEATKDANIALYELNQLRGAPLEAPLRIANTNLKFEPIASPEVLLAIARTNNFEIRTRQVELAQQGLRVDLNRNEKKPSISAGPFYSQEGGDEKERIIGLGLSMPLPLWNRNQGNIETAEARQQQAETSLLVTQRGIERALLEKISSYNALLNQMSFWRPDSLKQLSDAAELGDRHYRLGSLPISTYTELQEKFLEATEAILDTQREALEGRQEIERLIGEPIPTKSHKEAK